MSLYPYINPANDTNSGALGGTQVTIPLRWRQSTTTMRLLGSDIRLSTASFTPGCGAGFICPGAETVEGSWQIGGTAEIQKQSCHEESPAAGDVFIRREIWLDNPPATLVWNVWSSHDSYRITKKDVEIDWSNFYSQLKTLVPLGLNKQILGITFEDGDNGFDLTLDGTLTLPALNFGYGNLSGSFSGSDGTLFNDNMILAGDIQQKPLPDGGTGTVPVYDDLTVEPLNDSAQVVETSGDGFECQTSSFMLPMSITVWLGDKAAPLDDPEEGGVVNVNDSSNSSEPSNSVSNLSRMDIITMPGGDSNMGTFSGGGYNPVQVFIGNSVLPFDSIYFTSGNYNNFVAGGGGIVTESGIFANGAAIYIDNIHLSIEGSTMTVIQISDFDATALLTVGERIFGYIINQSGDYESSFTGFISSKKRTLTGKGESIVYTCRDLKNYLSQYITPAYFTYIPPDSENSQNTVTLETIVKDILVRAGLNGANINLPGTMAPQVEWTYESVQTVLEWAARYFGDHVYYIDKSGVLNFEKFTSGTLIKSFRIPSRGESVSSITKVLSFRPIEDHSRSRSKLVLVGDFPVREISGEGIFDYPTLEVAWTLNEITGYKPTDAFIIDPKLNTKTGIFCFLDTKYDRYIYYFMYFPGKTLVTELPSNPDIAAKFLKLNDIYSGNLGITGAVHDFDNTPGNILPLIGDWTMTPEHINTIPGHSFIYITDKVSPGAASIMNSWRGNKILRPTQTTISYRYAIREDEPLKVTISTGHPGGVGVIKESAFKKVVSSSSPIDDTNLMLAYLNQLKNFYKPEFGGSLEIDGLDTDLTLLGKLSITNTSLPSEESDNLVIHSILYDVSNKKTTAELTNKTFYKLPFFDVEREIARARSANKVEIAKLTNEYLRTGVRRV